MIIVKQTIPINNYDTSRKPITHVVIHWIVGSLASADATFKNPARGASAHYGIENSTVFQWVDEAHTAYHAGNYAYNQKSIGIEHSAAPDRVASEATYQSSGQLVKEICQRHNIPLDRTHIVGHKEVSATQCPGTMNIDKIISIAKGGGSMTSYKGYDLDNKDSMKVAVDILVRVQGGEFVDKPKYDADIKALQNKLRVCESIPIGNPGADKTIAELKTILTKVLK